MGVAEGAGRGVVEGEGIGVEEGDPLVAEGVLDLDSCCEYRVCCCCCLCLGICCMEAREAELLLGGLCREADTRELLLVRRSDREESP